MFRSKYVALLLAVIICAAAGCNQKTGSQPNTSYSPGLSPTVGPTAATPAPAVPVIAPYTQSAKQDEAELPTADEIQAYINGKQMMIPGAQDPTGKGDHKDVFVTIDKSKIKDFSIDSPRAKVNNQYWTSKIGFNYDEDGVKYAVNGRVNSRGTKGSRVFLEFMADQVIKQ